MPLLKDLRERVARALRDPRDRAIGRRYMISNGFDGTLTSVGVTVGSYLSGVPNGWTVVAVGVGAAVGLATSGVWSVWEIERAEREAELQRIEDAMLTDLHGTSVGSRQRAARVVHSLMSGMGPIVGVLVPLSPFLLEGTLLSMLEATLASVAVGVLILFGAGAYLARVSGLNWFVSGVRMGIAGLVVAFVNWIVGRGGS